MKIRAVKSLLAVTAIALTLNFLTPSFAQESSKELKPVVVVSVAGVNKIVKDIQFLSRSADVADVGMLASLTLQGFAQGLDPNQPAGLYVLLDGAEAKSVAFIPVTDFDTVRQQIEDGIGDVEEAGGGVLRLSTDERDVFLKPQDGWLFVAEQAGYLAGTPKDPSKMLGGLDKEYDLAARVNVGNVPAEFRDLIVSQIKVGFERGVQQEFGGALDDTDVLEKLQREAIDSYIALVEEADQVTLGWAIDPKAKQTYMDFSVTARKKTDLARQMKMLGDTTSGFAGFQLENAAMSTVISSKMGEAEIAQARKTLKSLREGPMKELMAQGGFPTDEVRDTVEDVMNTVMDVADKTIASGKTEVGAVLLLDDGKFKFAAGGKVADGVAIENAFRKMVDLAKDEPELPEVNFDAGKHQGVTFHTMQIPIEGERAQELIGDSMDVALGIGKESVYLAMGDDSMSLLKEVIDGSLAKKQYKVKPMEMSVAVGPILKFASKMGDRPIMGILADSLEGAEGRDHVKVSAQSIERGVRYRLNVEDGVLKMVGQAVRFMGAQQGDDFGGDF